MANSWWCGSFPQKNTCCNKVFKWLFEGWPRGCCNSRSAGCADHLLSGPEFRVCLAFWGCEWEDLNDENWPNRWQNHHTETTFWRGIFWYCRLFWVGETVKHPELLILLYHDLWLLWCRWKLSNSRIFGPPCINSSEIMVYLSLKGFEVSFAFHLFSLGATLFLLASCVDESLVLPNWMAWTPSPICVTGQNPTLWKTKKQKGRGMAFFQEMVQGVLIPEQIIYFDS